MDSGYPTRDVVKTASPLMFALAPKLLPWWIGPSLIVNVALSKVGLVERALVGGGAERGVPSATVALDRTWKDGLRALVKPDTAGLKAEGLMDLEKTKDAMVVDLSSYSDKSSLIHVGLPKVV